MLFRSTCLAGARLLGGLRSIRSVLKIFKQKYGKRLLDVVPAPSSEDRLWGDKLGAPAAVEASSAELSKS